MEVILADSLRKRGYRCSAATDEVSAACTSIPPHWRNWMRYQDCRYATAGAGAAGGAGVRTLRPTNRLRINAIRPQPTAPRTVTNDTDAADVRVRSLPARPERIACRHNRSRRSAAPRKSRRRPRRRDHDEDPGEVCQRRRGQGAQHRCRYCQWVVTLKGSSRFPAGRDAAEQLARETAGVKRVVNELRSRPARCRRRVRDPTLPSAHPTPFPVPITMCRCER